MKVRDLKPIVNAADDDDEVLLPASDHYRHYRPASSVSMSRVNRGKGKQRREWWEYWGDEHQDDELESEVVVAVVIV